MAVPVAAALALTATEAHAASTLSVAYAAPSSCPSELSFERELTRRAPNVRVTEGGASHANVRVEQHGNRYDGALTLRDANGAPATRSVSGSTCDEVVTGLALIAALALDASGAAPSSTDSTTTTSKSAPTTDDGSASSAPSAPTTPSGVAPKPSSPTSTTRDKEPDPDEAATPRRARPISISLGAQGGVVTGIAPSATPTIAFFVDLAKTGDATLSPSLRLRFERAGDSSDPFSQGAAHFTWTEGGIDGCPIVWAPIARLRVAPCLRAEAGIVEASGVDASPARSETRPWLLVGAVGRGQLRLVGPVFVELETELYAPLVRDRFYLEPDTTVFRASAIAWGGSAGLGVTIW